MRIDGSALMDADSEDALFSPASERAPLVFLAGR